MPDTGWFRGAGGVVVELDVPAAGTHQRERFDAQLAAGELIPVARAVRVDVPGGGYTWAETDAAPEPEPEPDGPPPVEPPAATKPAGRPRR
ncbi:MAG: hypothetical protein IPM45_18005 [Acidimicrobiales bacterium]|nr:hypothetical protein [Acidimicrobiales bacterium]